MAISRNVKHIKENEEPQGLKLPERLLDQISSKSYDDDERFDQFNTNVKKRKKDAKPVSRKIRRKEEKQLKKQKKVKSKTSYTASKTNSKNKKVEDDEDSSMYEDDVLVNPKPSSTKKITKKDTSSTSHQSSDDPMAALMALKKGGSKKNSSDLRIVKEDDLDDEVSGSDFDSNLNSDQSLDQESESESYESDNVNGSVDDFSDFDNDDFEEEDDENDDFGNFEDEDIPEDPLAQLKKLKQEKAKAKESVIEPKAQLISKKEKKTLKQAEPEPQFILPPLRDDEDMEFYAKKLGLKNGKKSKLTKEGDDDLLGGLFDGLDFSYLDVDKEQKSKDEATKEREESLPFGSDDEISEGDFDTDVSFSEDLSSDDESDDAPRIKENPYVAPVENHGAESYEDGALEKPAAYIPPALRRKMALESNGSSPETIALQRSIKGPLNKLSEANIGTIVNDINSLYMSNSRHSVNECLVSILLDSVVQQGRLLDTFVYLHASLAVAIYRLQGQDFGAYFIQTLIEKFETYYQSQNKGKEVSNIISLLSSVYMLQLISSKLLYDVIKKLINELDETNAELLVRLVRNSGNQMRSDDPTALKEIVLLINKKVSTLPSNKINTRTQFLIETITSLKNNKLKINNESSHQLTIRLKKFLATLNNNKFNDPIQVSLEDIQNVETRGKWWLVGSAWKGHDTDSTNKEVNFNEEAMNDILDNAEPNWMELARKQRMNTDIRRAIFVSIMSANDYIDALTKLDKLALKRSQEREIPRVLTHCTGVEPAWNPYYGILASKLCDSHSYRKTFQFMLWDLLKDFDGPDDDSSDNEDFTGFDNDGEDDESKLKRILNLGRFFGFLLSEGSLPLHVLKNTNFLTASNDSKLFLEVLLVTFLDNIGKKSQVNAVGTGLKSKKSDSHKFDDKLLIERLLKAREQHSLLRGLQYFLSEKVENSDMISGKKQKKRVQWAVHAIHDIIDEFLKDSGI